MIRIIERRPIMGYQVTCPRCGSVFQFEENDYNSSYDRSSEIRYINCPVCGRMVYSYEVPWENVEIKED